MNEIGSLLKETRETSGVSLEEASSDLEIKPLILENIEDGNIGCFKDIFVLKEYIYNYAKYLGLDPEKTIDNFNEYLFEYTSKIPVKAIEKAIQEKNKENEKSDKVTSPYTNPIKKELQVWQMVLIVMGLILVAIILVWSVMQLAVNNEITLVVSYGRK